MLPSFRSKSANKGILVLRTDGFGLRATVIHNKKGELKVTVSVSSSQVEPVAALTDVLEQLQNMLEKNLPSQAILLHISAIPDLVEITGSFDAPGSNNLLEMLRWEMEGVVAMQTPNWDLGWLLMGRGYITSDQREELVQLVAEEKKISNQQGGRSPMRLGEVAIREGLVTQEQISECLNIQKQLQLSDQRLITQFRPQMAAVDQFESGEQDTAKNYLCTAMPVAQHQQWMDAVKKSSSKVGVRISLQKVYPFAGATVPLVADNDLPVLITEFHQANVFCAVVQAGQIVDVSMLKCSSHKLDIEALSATLTSGRFPDANRWLVADPEKLYQEAIAKVSEITGLVPEPLQHSCTQNIQPGRESLLAELGCANHFLGINTGQLVPLAGMPPPDPFYRKTAFKAAMAAMLVPLIIAGFEGFKYVQIQELRDQLIAKEKQIGQYKDSKKEKRKELDQAKENIAEYQDKQKELSSLKGEKQLVEQLIIKRQSFVERILPVLSESINDGVVLDSMQEKNWYEFSITGRAIDQASIDDFNQVLSISLESLNMYIASSPSNFKGDAALTQNGVYVFEFLLKRRAQ